MNKEEFLSELKFELKSIRCQEIDVVLEYYEELIDDKIESGKKEKEVIKKLGDIKNIAKEVKIEQKLEIAEKKPTISNGIKALIAALSILSLPLLVPLLIVAAALVFTGIVLIASLVIVIGSIIFSAFAVIVALIAAFISGNLPFYSFIFGFGVAFLILGVFLLLIKWTFEKLKLFTKSFIDYLRMKFNKRKEVNKNE